MPKLWVQTLRQPPAAVRLALRPGWRFAPLPRAGRELWLDCAARVSHCTSSWSGNECNIIVPGELAPATFGSS